MPDATDLTTDKRWVWLATMPQGAAKTFVALLLMFITGLVLWGAVLLEKKVEEAWLWPWLTAITAILGVSHLDFRIKRQTYIPAPPGEPDIEDSKAGVPTTQEQEIQPEPLMKRPAAQSFEKPVPVSPLLAQLPAQPVRKAVRDE